MSCLIWVISGIFMQRTFISSNISLSICMKQHISMDGIMFANNTFDSSSDRLGGGDGDACSGEAQRNNEERCTEHDVETLQRGETVVRRGGNELWALEPDATLLL